MDEGCSICRPESGSLGHQLTISGATLPLYSRFDPGEDDDGVTPDHPASRSLP
jgi:hypothetical protein